MDYKNSFSVSYATAGVDITAGYKAVELMKKHVAKRLECSAVVAAAPAYNVAPLPVMWLSCRVAVPAVTASAVPPAPARATMPSP